MINPHFVIIGALLQLLGISSYLVDTVKGKARPNRVSWFMWALGPFIAFSAELSHHIGTISLMTFMSGFGPLLIFLVSFLNKKSFWKTGKTDLLCGGLSCLGLILWQLTGVGNLAIFFSIVADFLAWLPTFVKSYKEPESENWHFFLFETISAGITLLAIQKWEFADWGWPIWISSSSIVLVICIKFKVGPFIDKAVATHG